MQVQAGQSHEDVRHYLRIVGRRRWLILGLTLLVGLSAYAWSTRKVDLYQTTAVIQLFVDSDESSASVDRVREVANEIGVFGSREVRDAVVDQIGSDAPSVSVTADGDTDLLRVTATSSSARAAQRAANTYVAVYRQMERAAEVERLTDELSRLRQERATAQQVVDALVASRNSLLAQVNATPPGPERDALSVRLSDLEAQTSTATATLTTIRAEQDAEIDRLEDAIRESTGGVRILNPAPLPTEPFYPDTGRDVAIGVTIGLLVGLALAIAMDQLDDRLREAADLEQIIGDIPVIGSVPRVTQWKNEDHATLAMVADADSPVAESYRGLVSSIEFLLAGAAHGVVAISSPNVSEGKTTTVANLGAAFAEAGNSVVVVDADLRRPRIHSFYGLDRSTGFAQVLSGKYDVAEVRRRYEGQPGLDVIVAGPVPPNPTELLRSDACETALGKLADSYDIVLIDCPPVLPVSDVFILSRLADLVVLVASAESTRRRHIIRALKALRQVDAPLRGVLMNRVNPRGADIYDYYDSTPSRRRRRRSPARDRSPGDW